MCILNCCTHMHTSISPKYVLMRENNGASIEHIHRKTCETNTTFCELGYNDFQLRQLQYILCLVGWEDSAVYKQAMYIRILTAVCENVSDLDVHCVSYTVHRNPVGMGTCTPPQCPADPLQQLCFAVPAAVCWQTLPWQHSVPLMRVTASLAGPPSPSERVPTCQDALVDYQDAQYDLQWFTRH